MGELAQALAESYAEDLKAWFRFEVVITAVLAMLLFWAVKDDSSGVLTNLGRAKLSDLGDAEHGITSLPIFVLMGSIALGFLLDWLHSLAARTWFHYVLGMPAFQERLRGMELEQQRLQIDRGQVAVRELLSAERDLRERRDEVKQVLRASKLLLLLSVVLTLASFKGDAWDATTASAMMLASLFLLKQSAGVFIRRVGPKLAEVRAITATLRRG
jgi:hypothetical protein